MSFFQQFFMWLGIIACILPCLLLIGGVIWLFLWFVGSAIEGGLRNKYPLDYLIQIGWVIDLFRKYGFEESGYIDPGSDMPGVKMKHTAGNKVRIYLDTNNEYNILIKFIDQAISLSIPEKTISSLPSKYFILESLLNAMYGDSEK